MSALPTPPPKEGADVITAVWLYRITGLPPRVDTRRTCGEERRPMFPLCTHQALVRDEEAGEHVAEVSEEILEHCTGGASDSGRHVETDGDREFFALTAFLHG